MSGKRCYTEAMKLSDYFAERRGNAARLAKDTGAAKAFLRAIASGERPCPPRLAVRIEQSLGGRVSRRDLFPDDYAEMWPELAQEPAHG